MTTHTCGARDAIDHPAMKKSPHKIHKIRELGKAQNPDPQNRQRGLENESNEKLSLEQKTGDPLSERTISPQRRRFEQQLAASPGRCIGHSRGNLAQRKTIAHRLGFRSTTRMASNKLTGSPSRFDIAMRLGLRPDMRVS